MEIHKPKPWHGWREFLKEYLIIVVGVLTALSAEAVVESLHWREKVHSADGQLRLELSRAYADAQERIALAPCLNKRISQLEERLVQSKGAWRPLPPMPLTFGGNSLAFQGVPRALVVPGRAWDNQFWRTSLNDGTVAHMDDALQPKLARVYWQIERISEQTRDETVENNALNVLSFTIPLDDATRATLLQELERERGHVNISANLSRALTSDLRASAKIDLSIAEDLLKTSGGLRACRELGLL